MTQKSEVEQAESTESATEASEQTGRQLVTPKRRIKVRITDIIVFALILVVIVGLTIFIIGRISLKNEVNQAKVVTDKTVAAMAKQDTSAIRALGDKSFQAKNTAQALNDNLTSTDQDGNRITFAELYGKNKPTVSQRIVVNNSNGQHVVIIYRYDRLKVPFFVRVDAIKAPGSDKWQLQALSASPDESKLVTRQ